MSHQVTLRTWSGASKSEAAEKLAKVFQLRPEKSMDIVYQLCQGLHWRFDQGIPDHQADTAFIYLTSLGFVVDIHPVESEIEPLSNSIVKAEASETAKFSIHEYSYRFTFIGGGRTFLKISFINLIKTVFTLGIYRFWAKTNVRKYIWDQTLFTGDRFSYHGTGKELRNRAFRFGGVIFLLGLINIYIMFNIGLEESKDFFNLLSLLIVTMIPVFLVGVWKYQLSRTAWRNIRFSFRGKRMNALTLYIMGGIITAMTLGLYWPFFKMKSEKFWREHSWFGNIQFRFSGTGKDFFGKFAIAAFLTPFTLGFYLFWFIADLKRYLWSHTHVGELTFHFPIKGRDYMKLKVINFFILFFTLGVGFPWAMVRNQNFVTGNLVLAGNIELNRIVQEMKVSGEFGEEALYGMDIPIDIS